MQRLNHHHLYIFWIFCRTASFTKTAEELAIAQSAVTSQLQQLEQALNLTLIDRANPRRPEITAEGRKVLEYAESIFESSRELLNWATHGALAKQKVLRIGALSGLSRNLQYEFVQPLLEDSSIKFEIKTGDQENLLRQMKERSLDVILSSHNVRSEGRVPFYAHVLTSSPVVFAVHRKSKGRTSKHLKDYLSQYPLFTPGSSFESKAELNAFLEALKIPIHLAGEIDDIALLRIIALRSGAVVALPQMGAKNEIDQGELHVISKAARIEQRFYAITLHQRSPSPEVEKLIRQIQKI